MAHVLEQLNRQIAADDTASSVSRVIDDLSSRPDLLVQAASSGGKTGGASPALSAWWARIAAMVRSGRHDSRLAGVALLRESAGRIDHASFSQQREAWSTMLLPMLHASEDAALRLSAAATLLRLLAVSAPWPLERRELASCAPRLMSTLLALLEDQAASQVDRPRPGRR